MHKRYGDDSPIAKEWQQRPLESIYAVVFLDAIHFHVRSEGRIIKKAVYSAVDEPSALEALEVFAEHTDDSVFKMLYLTMMDITKKWTGIRRDWSMIHAQLAICFDYRIDHSLRRGAPQHCPDWL